MVKNPFKLLMRPLGGSGLKEKMTGTPTNVWFFSSDEKSRVKWVKCTVCPGPSNLRISRLKKHFNKIHPGLSSSDGRCSGCNQLLSIDAIVAGHDCPTPTASIPHQSHKYSSAYNNLTPEQRQKIIQECAMGKTDPKEISVKWLCKLSKIRKLMKKGMVQSSHSSENPSLSALSTFTLKKAGNVSMDEDYEKPTKKAAPRKKIGSMQGGIYKLSEELAVIVGGDEMPKYEVRKHSSE